MQINTNNFFRWYSGSVVTEQSVNLPRLGLQDGKIYLPCLVPGETTGFYINADVPFYDADQTPDLQLKLNDGTVIGAILQKVVLAAGYRLYASFAFPPNVLPGQYQYEILNTTTQTVKCISNYFQVIDPVWAAQYTCAVQWQNSRDAYYYDWSQIPDFFCALRLNLSLSAYNAEGTVDQTKAVSTGTRRNNNYDIDFSVKLQTYYFDDGANLACIPLFTASTIIINGVNYINKNLYVANVRVQSGVSIGEIELYNQPYSRINKYGQLPQLVLATGKYVFVNNTAVNWSINLFTFNNIGLLNIIVPAGNTHVVNIKDLQINGKLNINPVTAGNYKVVTSNSLPDGTFQFADNTITTTAQQNPVTQNQIYGNDWFVVIS